MSIIVAAPFPEAAYQPKGCHGEALINVDVFAISRGIVSRIGLEGCTLCDEAHPAAIRALTRTSRNLRDI
jgi:hypothetical protein